MGAFGSQVSIDLSLVSSSAHISQVHVFHVGNYNICFENHENL
jgi:hypothetical protein